ncbi:MAG TPA: SIS domain-containing protein [Alphaproteobacteria bacterium]|nr:SIS domain-containing protein [Alphaproteobacteria bacterium]
MSITAYLNQSAETIRAAANHVPPGTMERAIALCVEAFGNGKPVLVCGNGGSASDAMHITGELVGRFLKERRALNCICLSDNPATLTAWANDYDYASVFARQVEAYGAKGGVLIAISTSGNSANVVQAAEKAKAMGLSVIALTGQGGGKLAAHCDLLLDAPSKSTPLIQQVHICLYHYLCEQIEARMAG